ncbi:MAG: hypothetical protein IT210_23390 [Armatimonadetes bacterium]|nr:hypothetical protein [Armatimonadota bacterium]
MIPKFSLDTGYEFYNVPKLGVRQCLLQSTLLAAWLQEAGMDAGVVMVYKSRRGEVSNNGHAITLVKLANGQDIQLDASSPTPFTMHGGLFVRAGDYRYLQPVFGKNSPLITGYRLRADQRRLTTGQVKGMDYAFIRSQFYYYRAERIPDGVVALKPSPGGLAKSRKALEAAVSICPKNPLAAYMLGRTYLWENRRSAAASALNRACELYARFGFVPEDPKQYRNKVALSAK